ncbi:MAG: ATP-binding protein [Clostridia bacterium]|nr:ATP-binding protein [Clostridia bacterium]
MNEYTFVRVIVMAEMLVGDILFFYPYRKRSHFAIRFSVSVIVSLGLALASSFINLAVEDYHIALMFESLICYILCIVVFVICFDLKFKVTLALCCSGYALEHIIYQLSTLFQNLPFGNRYAEFMTTYHHIVEVCFFIVFYAIFFFAFGRRIAKLDTEKYYNNMLNAFAIFIVIVCILLSIFSGGIETSVLDSVYAIIACFLALILQYSVVSVSKLHMENEYMRDRLKQDLEQYDSMKAAVDFINIKCHDIRKELNDISSCTPEHLSSLKSAIDLYDVTYSTGNDIVNTILANATMHLSEYSVKITFSGNAGLLDFMDDTDLKTLMLNCVTNAGDAAKEAPKDKRYISITLADKGEMLVLTEKNYYTGPVITAGKLPPSTKKKDGQRHGLGLKSIDIVARKYHGNMSVTGNGSEFILKIALMRN